MPDPGYKIPIDVEIATTGAAQGEAAIDTQGQGAKRLDDVLKRVNETTQRVKKSIAETGTEADSVAPKVDRVISLQRAQIAAQLAVNIGQAADGIRQLAIQAGDANKDLASALMVTSVATESLSQGLSLAAQGFAVGGPLGAGIGATVGLLVGPLKSAFEDMNRSLAAAHASQKNAADSADKLTQARARLATEVLSEKLGGIYAEELDYIERQIKALESRGRIREAQRNADSAAAGPVSGSDAIWQAMNSKLAAETDKISDAEGKLRLLQEAAARAEDIAASAQDQYTVGQATAARVKAAVADAKTAALAAGTAETALEELKAISAATRQQILFAARDSLSGLATETNATITEQAQAALAVMQAKAAEQGGQLGILAKGSFDTLTRILTDSIPDASQTEAIEQAMKSFRSSAEARDSAIFQGITSMITNTEQLARGYADLLTRINAQRAQIDAIYQGRR
jgi:hypothetical protein